jgi:hypothetical protein
MNLLHLVIKILPKEIIPEAYEEQIVIGTHQLSLIELINCKV